MTLLPKTIENLNEDEATEHLEALQADEARTEKRLSIYGSEHVPAPVEAGLDMFTEYEARHARLTAMEARLEKARAKAKSTPAPVQVEASKPESETPEEKPELTATEQCLKVRKEIARPIPQSENVTATCRATVQENRRQLEAVRTLSSSK